MRLLIGMDRSLSEIQFLMPAALNLMPIPLLAMATMSDSDQDLVIEIYYHHRKLMYHVGRKYFADKPEELDDAVSAVLERLCRYISKVRAVPRNKMQAYVVFMTENVCRRRLRQIITEREIGVVPYDALLLDAQAEGEDLTETIFDYADAKKVLASYKELSQRDQDIIWMRHVENMEYSEMAKMLNMQEGAIRTAIVRAKAKLRLLVQKGGLRDEE